MEWGGSRKPSFRRSPAPWDRVWTFTFNIQQRSNINSNMFSVEWNHFEKKHGNITTSSWQNFEKKLLLFFLVWEREARHLQEEDFCFDDNQTCGEAFDRCSPSIVWFWSMLGKPTPTRKDDFFFEKNPNLKIEHINLNSVIKPQVLLPYASPVTLLCWRHPDNEEE